jgi:transcription initiation factor IIF auxiliary subunit
MSLSIQADTSAIYSQASSIFGSSKISASATAKSSTSSQSSDDEVTAVSSQGDTLTISSAGSNLAANATANSSDDSSSTEDLSQYTEYQLKQMLQNGEITQAEYNAEIQSREETSTD